AGQTDPGSVPSLPGWSGSVAAAPPCDRWHPVRHPPAHASSWLVPLVQVGTHLPGNRLRLTKPGSFGARDVERLQRVAVLASRQVEQTFVIGASSRVGGRGECRQCGRQIARGFVGERKVISCRLETGPPVE